MKKQLNKSQLEKRKHILHKVKNVVFYVSLAFNLLIGVCFAISGCSSNTKSTRSTTANSIDTTNLVLPKKQLRYDDSTISKEYALTGFDIWTNQNTCGFDLYRPSSNHPNVNWSYQGSLSTENKFIVVTSGVSISYDTLSLRFYMTNPTQSGNFIEIACTSNNGLDLEIYRGFYWSSASSYNIFNTPMAFSSYYGLTPNYNSDNGLAVLFNYSYLKEIGLGTKTLLEAFFNYIAYKDFNLTENWTIHAYFNDCPYGIWDRHIYNPFYLIKNGAFSINGIIYTDLLPQFVYVDFPGSSYTYRIHYDGENYITRDAESKFTICSGLLASNRYDDRLVTVLSYPRTFVHNDDWYIDIYPFDIKFSNYQLAYIRQFDVNSNIASDAIPYHNGGVLSVQGKYQTNITGGGSGSSSDAFDMFDDAFTGLASIFNISILPGISIGLLIFIPLIATIVFAVLKVIKK